MKRISEALTLLIFGFSILGCAPGKSPDSSPKNNDVLIISDFEKEDDLLSWKGTFIMSGEFPAHGESGLKISPENQVSYLESETIPSDWSNYQFLKFDIYNSSGNVSYGTIRIFDREADDEEAEFRGQSYNGDGKLFLNRGWNHFKFMVQNAMVEEGNRSLKISAIRKIRFSFRSSAAPFYIDNIRLVNGEEGSNTSSSTDPRDCHIVIDNRNVYPSLAGPLDKINTSSRIINLREKAKEAVERLESEVKTADLQGFQTLYQRIPLITANVGMGIRSKLVWFQNEKSEEEILTYVIESCTRASSEIADMLSASQKSIITVEPENDVSNTSLYVPPYPPLGELKISDGVYRDKTGKPVILLSMLQIDDGPLMDYFAPFNHRLESYTVGGGSRYNIESSPVYEAFHKYPGTHRVGWDGWCGHLIKDRWAMGGKKEDVVICLESPDIKRAVREYMRLHYKEWVSNPDLLYNIMAYELQYICYCDKSQEMFRNRLRAEYKTISALNNAWQTQYKDFSMITAPPAKNAAPQEGVNRAAWYDWANFNTWRFTEYMKWIKSEMRKFDAETPICAGGTSSMLSSSNSVTGIDEEMIINEVDDVILNESGESPIFSDLLLSLSEDKKVMVDPEMGGGTHGLLLQFLHGKADISKWWWAGSPSTEYMSMNESSLPHSNEISLADIDEVLRIGLDVRRLGSEIAEFTRHDPEAAILYSKTSILQVPPGQIQAGTTPYIDALRSVWEGARFLGCRTGFISEKQIAAGKLSKIKLLIIPAVKYIRPEIAAIIRKYIENGGTVVIIPESFMFDQYAHEKNMLTDIGISISGVTLPPVIGESERVQNYDQSFSKAVLYGEVKRPITGSAGDLFSGDTLFSEGLVQKITPGNNKVLAGFDDGSPAIILSEQGKGSLYYLASPLRSEDYPVILTKIADKSGLKRPVIARGQNGKPVTDAEVRGVELDDSYLVYASNLTSEIVEFDLEGKYEAGTFIDLRSLNTYSGRHIVLRPYQETILKAYKLK